MKLKRHRYLRCEAPGSPDTLLDVLDEAVTRLQPGVVIQRRPDLAAHLLQQQIFFRK